MRTASPSHAHEIGTPRALAPRLPLCRPRLRAVRTATLLLRRLLQLLLLVLLLQVQLRRRSRHPPLAPAMTRCFSLSLVAFCTLCYGLSILFNGGASSTPPQTLLVLGATRFLTLLLASH